MAGEDTRSIASSTSRWSWLGRIWGGSLGLHPSRRGAHERGRRGGASRRGGGASQWRRDAEEPCASPSVSLRPEPRAVDPVRTPRRPPRPARSRSGPRRGPHPLRRVRRVAPGHGDAPPGAARDPAPGLRASYARRLAHPLGGEPLRRGEAPGVLRDVARALRPLPRRSSVPAGGPSGGRAEEGAGQGAGGDARLSPRAGDLSARGGHAALRASTPRSSRRTPRGPCSAFSRSPPEGASRTRPTRASRAACAPARWCCSVATRSARRCS